MPASYKIPQNVDLEDKILGPLTLKQFIYALLASLATFLSFNAFYAASPPLFGFLTFVIWVTAVAFIFVRPNDQPFTRFFFAFLWFSLKPQRRMWRRIPSLGRVHLTEAAPPVAPHSDRPSSAEAKSRLQNLAHLVDTRGWSDLDAADLADRVTSGEAKPQFNIMLSESEQPEDILAAEDERRGTDRATAELDRVLKRGGKKSAAQPREEAVHG